MFLIKRLVRSILAIILIMSNVFLACGQRRFKYKAIPATFRKFENFTPAPRVNLVDVTKFLPNGHVIDGSVDYTFFLQKAIDSHSNIILPNFPILVNDSGLILKSNSTIQFQPKTKLILKPSSKKTYYILKLHRVQNVTLVNPQVQGDRMRHIGSGGEWGMGIDIRAATNIKVYNPTVTECWGDGIYIGQSAGIVSRNIKIINAYLDNNRRNGLSITSGVDINIIDPIVANTYGTLPMCGIDIEPNNNSDQINNITIEGALTYNNYNSGIIIGLGKLIGSSKKDVNISISNHIDEGSNIGFYYGGILPESEKKGKALSGLVKVENP